MKINLFKDMFKTKKDIKLISTCVAEFTAFLTNDKIE